ncbi:hypothetical protein HOY80DRAFT_1033758 [Tuber brumale]|nr:hypothetical protein HOY80DRAFT_1033758 [Tuber brumale]
MSGIQSPHQLPREQQRASPTELRITALENKLARLRAQREMAGIVGRHGRELGMYSPIQTPVAMATESASGIADSVEALFSGVEKSTLSQIIENRFKLTNIYRLLASKRDRAESQHTISIGGVEFEQAERDGKQSEYWMSSFFKAWAAYSGILVKLAPYGVQGDLATTLFIYTINLYDLLEKYTWDSVKSYHFQFHRKRVASGKNIYLPSEWQTIDSELIASKCFALPISRSTWAPGQTGIPTQSCHTSELSLREGPFSSNHRNPGNVYTGNYGSAKQQGDSSTSYQSNGPAAVPTFTFATNLQAYWN